jgi:hypothetical protein
VVVMVLIAKVLELEVGDILEDDEDEAHPTLK